MRSFAVRALKRQGYEVVEAASGLEGLERFEEQGGRIDIVVSDVVMPGMNGIELGMEVRRRYPGLPVVLTSGYNAVMASEGQYGFELVLKPYTRDTLVRAVGKALVDQE